MELTVIQGFLTSTIVPALGRIIVAILAWMIGRRIIGFVIDLLRRNLQRQKMDATAANYLASALSVLLTVGLVLGIVSLFGIETTSFAALLAGAGLAIGAAVSGLLAHFAAGILMLIFRPFKVGDAINAGGATGVVKEIGLLTTTLDTADNVRVMVGNNKIFSDNIVNYSANPHRMAMTKVEIDGSHDHNMVINLLTAAAKSVPNALSTPAPATNVVELKAGPVLGVAVHCHNDHFPQVSADLNRIVKEALAANKITPPVPAMRTISA
jgi:small conductance mechanosensitive channel